MLGSVLGSTLLLYLHGVLLQYLLTIYLLFQIAMSPSTASSIPLILASTLIKKVVSKIGIGVHYYLCRCVLSESTIIDFERRI